MVGFWGLLLIGTPKKTVKVISMEQEKNLKQSEKNKTLAKFWVGLLLVLTIGQISALLIPAMVGQSPSPTSLIGSVLWPSLLFMSIWTLKRKRKKIGFMIGSVVGLFLYCSVGFLAGYSNASEEAIDRAIAAGNKDLPKMINEGTRLNSASIDHQNKLYTLDMTLINYLISEIDIGLLNDNFYQLTKPSTCNIPNFKVILTDGYTINYVYKDKDGKFISKYSVSPTECN